QASGGAAGARFSPRARSLPDRLRPRPRQRPHHRAGGARPGAVEETRRGGGTGAELITPWPQPPRHIRKLRFPPPKTAATMALTSMARAPRMLAAGIAARAALTKNITRRKKG